MKTDNPLAFPRAQFNPQGVGYEDAGIGNEAQEGMTLRDYFAIRFAAAWHWSGSDTEQEVAHRAYARADAMLEARSKP